MLQHLAGPLAYGALKAYAIYAHMVNDEHMGYMPNMAKEPKYPIRKLAYFSEGMAKSIDDYRYANRVPSENESIRRLIAIGLAAEPIIQDVIRMFEEHGSGPDAARHIDNLKKVVGDAD